MRRDKEAVPGVTESEGKLPTLASEVSRREGTGRVTQTEPGSYMAGEGDQ